MELHKAFDEAPEDKNVAVSVLPTDAATSSPRDRINSKISQTKLGQLTEEPFLQTEIDLICLLAECPAVTDYVMENIRPEFLSDSKIGQIIRRVVQEEHIITPAVVRDVLRDPIYEFSFGKYGENDAQKIIDAVINNWKYRHLTSELPNKLAKIKSINEGEQLIEKASGLLSEGKVDMRSWDKTKYGSEYLAYLDNKTSAGYRTGIPPIDEKLCGGFEPGEHIVISADTGVGKTLLVTQILKHFAEVEKIPCALFALEMLRNQMLTRIVPMIDNTITAGELKSKKYNGKEKNIADALKYFETIPMYIVDDVRGISNIYKQIRVLARRGIKAVAIDYIQLCMDDPTSVKEFEMITKNLKLMANHLGIMIFTIAQFHRKDDTKMFKTGIIKREPIVADLKGGSALEQNADRIIFLYIPPEIEGEAEAFDFQHVKVILAKDRNGPKFKEWMVLLPSICTFVGCNEELYPSVKENQNKIEQPPEKPITAKVWEQIKKDRKEGRKQ